MAKSLGRVGGSWCSKDGKNKISITQTGDTFVGHVGAPGSVKITLGTIAGKTLNFKQSWHGGANDGAVATVYGVLSDDGGTISLEFEGTRGNGKGMKGKNQIVRDSLQGSWGEHKLKNKSQSAKPRWTFCELADGLVKGEYSKGDSKKSFEGKKDEKLSNEFEITLPADNESEESELIKGVYKSPYVFLTIPSRPSEVKLSRINSGVFPKFEEYLSPLEAPDEDPPDQDPIVEEVAEPISILSQKKPKRPAQSQYIKNKAPQPAGYKGDPDDPFESLRRNDDDDGEDMRAPLLDSITLSERPTARSTGECCCCVS